MRKHALVYLPLFARPAAAVLMVLVALGMTACGYHSWELARDRRLTNAAGSVAVGPADRTGRPIEVSVFHVQEPAFLAAGAHSYVVWLCPGKGEQPQNLGALPLLLSGDALTSNGFLRAHTPYDQFRIFVTPEESAHAEAPRHPRVFWARIGSR